MAMILATVLALDPLPATALFYSGESGQAIGSGVLGLAGVGLMGGSVYSFFDAFGNAGRAKGLAIAGITTYAVALAWDAIGGIYYARKHNRALELGEYAVRPQIMADGRGLTRAVGTEETVRLAFA